jgi:hypothetical protein
MANTYTQIYIHSDLARRSLLRSYERAREAVVATDRLYSYGVDCEEWNHDSNKQGD